MFVTYQSNGKLREVNPSAEFAVLFLECVAAHRQGENCFLSVQDYKAITANSKSINNNVLCSVL